MEFDEESVRQIVLSLAAVGFFIGLIITIGSLFASQTGTAGLALVGSIALFILVMGGIGLYLARVGDAE